ncbi:hypothetical protein M0R45_034289 [Rubus argutus]|uniref:Uncharacterized protein n=1 Tax=Rubus argutus TaxID=59490 RepID=A0AAW1VSQ0_RUBAR
MEEADVMSRPKIPKPNSEEPNSAGARSCGICLKEHGPVCPYWDYVPPGATVCPGYSHESADCPHDEDKAAECRWIREVDTSKKYTPWVPNYVPRTPIPPELW